MDLVKSSLIKASLVTLTLLLIGVLVGLQMDDARTQFLEDQLQQTNLQTETFLVTQSYVEGSSKNYCRVIKERIPDVARKNAQIGQDLQSFSGKSIGNDDDYNYIKRKYYVNQLRLYTMLQGYKERCNADINLLLFFFDNSVDSKRQGAVLTQYRRTVDNQTYIFSYNLNTEKSAVLDILTTDYQVEEAPTVVVNGDQTYRRYVALKELKQVLE